jgi:hypothetical protein
VMADWMVALKVELKVGMMADRLADTLVAH